MTARLVALGLTVMSLGLFSARPGIAAPPPGPASVVFVDTDATPPGGIGDGKSWETAYVSLALALALEPGPAEFWVAEGTYRPVSFFGDPRFPSIGIGPGQEVYGGFAGTETERIQRNTGAHVTTLSGAIGTSSTSDNSYNVVRFALTGSQSAVLDGVKVMAGFDDRALPDGGAGGVLIPGGKPTLRDVRFAENTGRQAGAILITGGIPVLSRIGASGNQGLEAPGNVNTELLATAGSVTIEESYFESYAGNASPVIDSAGASLTARDSYVFGGTGIRLNGGNNEIDGVWFDQGKVGLDATNADVLVDRTAFWASDTALIQRDGFLTANNSLFLRNPGGFVTNTAKTRIVNSTFIDAGTGISTAPATIQNSIVAAVQNTPAAPSTLLTVEDSIMEAACGGGISCSNVSNADPGKIGASATFAGSVVVHASLQLGSPALDAGNPDHCLDHDSAGEPRPEDGDGDGTAVCDQGADELEPGLIAFATATSSASEGSGSVPVTVHLSLPSGVTSLLASVDYSVAPGTADTGDFVPVTGTLTFDSASPAVPAGMGPQVVDLPVSIRLKEDFLVEKPETIVVTLSNPRGAFLGAVSTLVLTIRDNEPRLKCAGVAATIVGSPAADIIVGTDKRDVIVARGGNDRIRALAGNDRVCGGPGDDTVRTGAGNDVAFGHGGEDVLTGGPGRDELRGGGANDALNGGGGDDTLLGQRGDDTVKGNTGRDRLSGGPGAADHCDGGPGTDALLPNAGCESTAGVP